MYSDSSLQCSGRLVRPQAKPWKKGNKATGRKRVRGIEAVGRAQVRYPRVLFLFLISLTVLEVTYIIMPSCEKVFASRWHRLFNDHITTARIKVTLNVTFLLELAIPACIVATTQRGPRATTPRQHCQQWQQWQCFI